MTVTVSCDFWHLLKGATRFPEEEIQGGIWGTRRLKTRFPDYSFLKMICVYLNQAKKFFSCSSGCLKKISIKLKKSFGLIYSRFSIISILYYIYVVNRTIFVLNIILSMLLAKTYFFIFLGDCFN